MQSSRSLIALGIGTAVAVSSVAAAPGQAAPLASQRHADSTSSEQLVEEVESAKPTPLSSNPIEQPAVQQPIAEHDPQMLPSKANPIPSQPSIEFSSPTAKADEPGAKPQSAEVPSAEIQSAEVQNAENRLTASQPISRLRDSIQADRQQTDSQEEVSQEEVSQEEVSQDAPTPTPAVPAPSPQEPAPAAPPSQEAAPAAPVPPAAPAPPQEPAPLSPPSPPGQEFSAPNASPPAIPTRTETSDEPAPEYLNPDPNPLSFPTQPEEVEIVGAQPITLRQAIELAIRNNRQLQEARLNVENNQAQLRQAQAQNFPTLTVQSGLAFQAQEQATPVRDPQTGETSFDGTSFPNSTSLTASIEGSYNIFTGGQRSAAIRAQRGQVRFQELQLEAATEELILQVTNNYYDLQNADEQVRIAQDSLTEAQQSLRDAQALERAGVGTRFDVLQAQVDVANAQQTLTQQISDQEVARRQIAQQLALAESLTITAADPIEPAGLWNLSLEETIVSAYRNRAELEQFLVQRDIGEQQRRQALGRIRPQVTASTSYGVSRELDNSASPTFDGFLSNFQAQIGVSWNIFDGGAARAEADQAETSIAIAENSFADQREQIRFAVEQAYSVLQSSYSNIQVTSLAVEQATEALRLARLRFQAGVGTQTDVLQQQTALTEAEVNRLTAILSYNRALATLTRQVSNYPEGNLADTP